jgi:hypothetical protein
MKYQIIKATLVSAFVLASPMLSFAGGQPAKMHKNDTQDRTGVTRAVQQGKGSGLTRNEGVHANAYREQTPAESQVVKEQSNPGRPIDTAFRK